VELQVYKVLQHLVTQPKYNVNLAETHIELHQSSHRASTGGGSAFMDYHQSSHSTSVGEGSFTGNHQSRRRTSVGIDFVSSTKLKHKNKTI
jgi:hypothetical protein